MTTTHQHDIRFCSDCGQALVHGYNCQLEGQNVTDEFLNAQEAHLDYVSARVPGFSDRFEWAARQLTTIAQERI